MKNNKGFTLLEILAVIVLLALISMIVFPKIKNSLNSAKKDLYDVQIKAMEDGAKNYLDDNPYDIPKNSGDRLTLSLCQLKMENKVDFNLANPKTNKMFNCATKIYVDKMDNKYKYTVDFANLEEEILIKDEKGLIKDKAYPRAKIVGGILEYMKINDEYDFEGVYVDNTILKESNGDYTINVNHNLPSLKGTFAQAGTYLIEYKVTKQNITTTLYKTIIVE